MVSLEEACEFLISHQGASVSSIKCSNGIFLTTFKLSSVFKELGREFMLSFWQSQLLFRTEFRWSWIVVSTTKLRLKTWSKERWYGSFLAILQIFWSEFRSEIKQTATDRSNFQSEKQSALSNSRSGVLLIKILKEFLKNSNQRKKIIWYSFRSLLKIS